MRDFCYSQNFLHSAAETRIINPVTENAETGEILYISGNRNIPLVYTLVHTYQFLYEGQPRLNAFSRKNKFYQQYWKAVV